MKTKFIVAVAISASVLLFSQANLFAQTASNSVQQSQVSNASVNKPYNSKPRVYIAPTQDGFGNFISAALLENKVPVQITASEETADYIIVSSSAKGQNKWYDTVFGNEKDRNQGSMKLIRVSDKTVVWASASGDKSFWFSEFKSMGQSKVANRLARKMKDALPKILAMDETNFANSQDKKTQATEILKQETPKAVEESSNVVKPALNAEDYNQEGVKLFQQNKYGEAESSFREAVKLDPYNAAYHHNLGTALNAQNKFDEAEKEVELATRLAPNEAAYKKGLEVIRANKSPKTLVKGN